jgi:ribosomal subunit interface protein
MRYQISGKQIDIGDSLQSHVKQELNDVVAKYAERPTEAFVTFSKDRHEFVCESSVHLSTGLTVNAKAYASEIYASLDACREKMEKQLRRYKRRLKDHHAQRATPVETFGAPSYILAQEDAGEDANEPDTLQPIIVAETQTKIKSLSVGEAVMQMELAGENVLVFQNEGQQRVNVVYKRTDGNIGWIDPE